MRYKIVLRNRTRLLPSRKFSGHSLGVSLFQHLQRRRARVLFVCLGNSCRSQMAEALARAYGDDVLEAHSAGIHPAARISRRTRAVLEEKGVSLAAGASTKHISSFDLNQFDVIVNLSEYSLPETSTLVLKRVLRDPTKGDADAFRDVREDVDQMVRYLIKHFRYARQSRLDPLYSKECAAAS
jgi:arsenate reductase